MHKRSGGNRGKLKGSNFKCQTCITQKQTSQINPGILSNDQSLEIVEKFYLGDIIGVN